MGFIGNCLLAGPLQQRLQREINLLAEAHGGPKFEPHVTLVPGFEADSKEAAIAAAGRVAAGLKVISLFINGRV